MKKICFVTGSRADYGILSTLMRKVKESEEAVLQVVATNMHLSSKFGNTVDEIIKDGFNVDFKVPVHHSSKNTSSDTCRELGEITTGMGLAFDSLKPDIAVMLGDRYEILGAAAAANIFNIPVGHLHGGETTLGAYDDAFRNAVTQMSALHFASTRQYADRIINSGINPQTVFDVGALGVENILELKLISKEELERDLNFYLGENFIIVTFHPETRSPGRENYQTETLIKSLSTFVEKGYKILATMPNSDTNSYQIIEIMTEWQNKFPDKIKLVGSLGKLRYFSALSMSSCVVGNSSSGIIEAPAFKVPTVNIGTRQKGRITGSTVIDCGFSVKEIQNAIELALSRQFKESFINLPLQTLDPYYKPGTSNKILDILLHYPLNHL